MDSPNPDLPSVDALPEGSLREPVSAEPVTQPVPFFQRRAWRLGFAIGLVILVWFLIGLFFTPVYFRF
jgi:hypothetical protein